MFQVKIGIRNMVMPGARMQMIVVTKLTPLRMVPSPDRVRPMIHMSPPMPGELIELVSGEYAYQPNAAAPPGAMKLASRISPPKQERVVAQDVEPRERDVGRADLQRHDLVREPDEQRGGEQQQHDRAVHREQLVVLLVGHDVVVRLEELGAHDHGHQARRPGRTRTT